ncbi:ImmA/IrrE family metallo-endopeptidase [Bradyrhizobium zhanjiangense]|nr:hypothetical protein [Bradyrhizobium zhanjiangense]
MRTYRANRGPFATRPFYKPAEIDRICADALKAAGLMPDTPEAVRVERFVEKHFKISPRYEALPDGVLGSTSFGPKGVTGIVITTALDEEGGSVSERRIRTTLAHEAGHGLLHTHLFALGEKPPKLFEDGSDRPEILCRDVHGTAHESRYDGRWCKFQANRAIGGLLMPRGLVIKAAVPFCEERGGLGLPTLKEDERERAARELAEIFDVNPVVARIRLDDLFARPESGQLTL